MEADDFLREAEKKKNKVFPPLNVFFLFFLKVKARGK